MDSTAMTEGEFRGRVLEGLEDLKRRMEGLEEFRQSVADHATRIRALEDTVREDKERRHRDFWYAVQPVVTLIVGAAEVAAAVVLGQRR
jgi:hypothetical protein